jgi:hypothetical protein
LRIRQNKCLGPDSTIQRILDPDLTQNIFFSSRLKHTFLRELIQMIMKYIFK